MLTIMMPERIWARYPVLPPLDPDTFKHPPDRVHSDKGSGDPGTTSGMSHPSKHTIDHTYSSLRIVCPELNNGLIKVRVGQSCRMGMVGPVVGIGWEWIGPGRCQPCLKHGRADCRTAYTQKPPNLGGTSVDHSVLEEGGVDDNAGSSRSTTSFDMNDSGTSTMGSVDRELVSLPHIPLEVGDVGGDRIELIPVE